MIFRRNCQVNIALQRRAAIGSFVFKADNDKRDPSMDSLSMNTTVSWIIQSRISGIHCSTHAQFNNTDGSISHHYRYSSVYCEPATIQGQGDNWTGAMKQRVCF